MTTTNTAPNFAADMFRQTAENFNKAVQAGVKLNEDTFRSFNENATRTTDEFRNRVERIADEMTPVTKKNVDRFTRLFDENTQRTNTFFRNAMDANPFTAPVNNPTELMDRTLNFWKSAFETTRESFDAAQKAGQDAWTNWTQCCKTCENVAQNTNNDSPARKPAVK